ncbi:hypothetical protein Peur_045895 [Populus x canadensis]
MKHSLSHHETTLSLTLSNVTSLPLSTCHSLTKFQLPPPLSITITHIQHLEEIGSIFIHERSRPVYELN